MDDRGKDYVNIKYIYTIPFSLFSLIEPMRR